MTSQTTLSPSEEEALRLWQKLASDNLFVAETHDKQPVKYFIKVVSKWLEARGSI